MKRYIKISITLLITMIIVLGFAVPLNQPNGTWYQQFLPSIGSRSIQDVFFLDSLTGWAVTNATNQANDTTFVLKTSNGGDDWVILYKKIQTGGGFSGYFKVYFLNQNTGYTCDVLGIYKTTNGGLNWVSLNVPVNAYLDMSVLNTDTIWIITPDSFAGGVFFTSNGGVNWQNQFSSGNQNPNKIYMYNARIGFISNSSALPNIYWTTNGGVNWIINLPGENFTDMFFTDSLTGWKCMPGFIAGDSCVKNTTNGGISWIKQTLPNGGIINLSQIVRFSYLNKDTIWGVGGQVNYGGNRYRGILYRTINGGTNWKFQVPDTSFGIPGFGYIQFINKNVGWSYFTSTGIHTTNGGDTTFLTGIHQISSEIPEEFMLFQNYPNPFNSVTDIRYQVMSNVKGQISNVVLSIFDITGREITKIVDKEQNAGTYEVDWNASGYSSGVYFYRLTVTAGKEVYSQTKKMILLK